MAPPEKKDNVSPLILPGHLQQEPEPVPVGMNIKPFRLTLEDKQLLRFAFDGTAQTAPQPVRIELMGGDPFIFVMLAIPTEEVPMDKMAAVSIVCVRDDDPIPPGIGYLGTVVDDVSIPPVAYHYFA